MRYVSREGVAGWQDQRESEGGTLRPGDAAELLVVGSGLTVVAGLSLVALWRLLAVVFGAG